MSKTELNLTLVFTEDQLEKLYRTTSSLKEGIERAYMTQVDVVVRASMITEEKEEEEEDE